MFSKYLSTFGSSTECPSTVAPTPDSIAGSRSRRGGWPEALLRLAAGKLVAPTKSVLAPMR